MNNPHHHQPAQVYYHHPTFSPSSIPKPPTFIEKWLIMPKLMFFCLGIISFGLGNLLTNFAQTHFAIRLEVYVAARVVGSLTFAIIADNFKIYRFLLMGCVAGYLVASIALLVLVSGGTVVNYVLFLSLTVLQNFLLAGTTPIVNAMIMSKLASNPDNGKELYGRQRIFSYLAQIIIKAINLPYLSLICLLSIASAAFISLVYNFDSKIDRASESVPKRRRQVLNLFGSNSQLPESSKSILTMFSNIKFIIIIVAVLIAGFNLFYLNTSLKFVLGENWRRIVSQSFFLIFIVDISAFILYKNLVKFTGVYWLWIIGHSILIIINLIYALISSNENMSWLAVIAGYSKPLSYGMLTLSIIHAASDLSSDNFAATAQSIFEIAFFGVSSLIAQPIVVNHLNAVALVRLTYTVLSILGTVMIVTIGIHELISSKNSSKSHSEIKQ